MRISDWSSDVCSSDLDLDAARPGPVEPGLLLVGGGQWPLDAFRWMIARAGHGHLVVMRASGAAEAQDEFYTQIGGVASAISAERRVGKECFSTCRSRG